MISKVLFITYIIIFSTDITYLSKLRHDTIKKVCSFLENEGIRLFEEERERIFFELNHYLKYKYTDFTDHMTYNYLAILPVANIFLLKRIITKSIKEEYKIYENSVLEDKFLKDNKLKKEETSYSINPTITPKSNIQTRSIVKKRVLKK